MIIITGASRGIGKFLLEHYLNIGEQVIGLYNKTEPSINREYYYQVDIANDKAVTEFCRTIEGKLKNVVLINAAGISYNAFAHKTELEKWRDVIDVNVIGLFNIISKLLPQMREEKYGRIINFSSVVAQAGVMGTSAYAASKSALWGMSKAIAVENGSKNITINNITSGYFNIGMIDEVPSGVLDVIIKRIPAGRLGHPQELLSTVNFIINTPYLNGACIDLNGGLY